MYIYKFARTYSTYGSLLHQAIYCWVVWNVWKSELSPVLVTLDNTGSTTYWYFNLACVQCCPVTSCAIVCGNCFTLHCIPESAYPSQADSIYAFRRIMTIRQQQRWINHTWLIKYSLTLTDTHLCFIYINWIKISKRNANLL